MSRHMQHLIKTARASPERGPRERAGLGAPLRGGAQAHPHPTPFCFQFPRNPPNGFHLARGGEHSPLA